MTVMKAIRIAARPHIVRRSLIVSAVVGTLLTLVNQHEALIDERPLHLTKVLLTYLVPYCVATYGSVMAVLEFESDK